MYKYLKHIIFSNCKPCWEESFFLVIVLQTANQLKEILCYLYCLPEKKMFHTTELHNKYITSTTKKKNVLL